MWSVLVIAAIIVTYSNQQFGYNYKKENGYFNEFQAFNLTFQALFYALAVHSASHAATPSPVARPVARPAVNN